MSTINYTYNVIVDRFRQFAAGHFQLRRFTHGEISQADLEKEAEWPWMHVKPRAINYSPGTRAFSFEIFISDLPRDKEDKTGYQAESITDCSLIFQDLINEIHLGQMFGDDVLLTRPVNSEPFVEQYTHTLTGVTGIIELSMDYDWSACSIPASWNYNTPTNSNSSGFGSLQFIESLEQNGVFVSLDNDVEAPGNSYYYGTNGAGVKGWYASQAGAGTVTSIDLTAGTGISVSGGPITSSGSITVTNSAPDQVVALTAGTGITTSGTYPNFTITNSAPSSGGTVTSVTATLPISSTGGATPNLSMSSADGTTNGYLSSTDWTTFNNKQAALVSGTNIKTINGNTVLGSGNLVVGGTQVGFKYNISVYSGAYPLPAAASGQAIILFYDDGSGAVFEGLSIHPTDANGLDAPSFILTELGKQPLTLFINSTSYTTFNNTQAVTFVGGAYRVTSNDYRGTDASTLHGQVGYFDFGTSNTGTVTSVAALTLGTSGADLSSTVANGTSTPIITLNVPTASAANRGALSAADWSTFNGKQAAITGAATTITTTNLTASRVLVSDASGKVAANTVTTTTLGFLDATSSIQTQLNAKGYAMGGNLNGGIIAVSTTYLGIGVGNASTSETTRRMCVVAGTVSRLFLRTAGVMTGSMAITLMKNGVATAMTFTIAATSAGALYSTTSNTFTVADGDELSIRIVQSTANSIGVTSYGFHIK